MGKTVPEQRPGVFYLTEGGQETELMYKYGFELAEFAMFPLLDHPRAVAEMRGMYTRYLDVAGRHGFCPLMGGLDYRASPDWGARLGYSPDALAELQLRSIDFLRDVAAPYAGEVPATFFAGIVGPRGDAYTGDRAITADEAEDYHSVQLATLATADVDLVEARTFNNVPEAVGLARAAAAVGIPVSISFTRDSSSRLHSGPTLKGAIEAVDAATGPARPAFYGINCSHPLEFGPALEPGSWFERVRVLRPNAARMEKIALCTLGHLESGDPPELASMMGELARRHPHLDVWGGCCGTWDTHLDQIAQRVLASSEASV